MAAAAAEVVVVGKEEDSPQERRRARSLRGPCGGERYVHEPALVYLRTELGRGHQHVAVFDEEGNGVTDRVDGHRHRIRELELEPAADGHTHELAAERAPVVEYYEYLALVAKLAGNDGETP